MPIGRQTARQADEQTDQQADRQTERLTDIDPSTTLLADNQETGEK